VQRDTAFGRREVGARAMKEDRAAAPASAAAVVVVEDDHDIIKVVVAPQPLVRPGTGGRHRSVVGGARRVVAPSQPRAERGQGQRAAPSPQPVRPIEAEHERKRADGARVIAFPLGSFQSAGADRAGKDERTCMETAGLELSLSSWRCAARHHETGEADASRSRSCGSPRRAFFWRRIRGNIRIHQEFTFRRVE